MKNALDLVAEAKKHIREIGLEEAATAIRTADRVIDVREADELAAGCLPRALHIPRGVLEFRLSALPEFVSRDLNIILYCKTSGRAALAAASLQSMGYRNVCSIEGGFDAWIAAGKPVQMPDLPAFG